MILRNSVYNMLGLGLPMVVAVVAIPVLIHGLGEARFGALTIIWAVVSYFGLFDLGLGRAVTQKVAIAVADGRRDELNAIMGTSSALMLALGVAGGIILALATPALARGFAAKGGVAEVGHAFFWMAAVMPAIVLTSGYRGALEAIGQFALVNVIRIPMGIYTFVAPMALVWAGYGNLVIISAALAFGRLIACIAHAWFALRAIEEVRQLGRFDRKFVKPLLRFGGWLSVMNTFGPLIGYIDRFMVGMTLGPEAVTHFVTPQEVSNKISLIPMAISTAAFPTLSASRRKTSDELISTIKRLSLINAAITALPALFIAVFSHLILSKWIGSAFADKTSFYLSIFAVGYFINSLAHVPLSFIVAFEGSKAVSFLYFIEMTIYIVVIYFTGRLLGLTAVAFVWLARIVIDTLVIAVMSLEFARRHRPDAS